MSHLPPLDAQLLLFLPSALHSHSPPRLFHHPHISRSPPPQPPPLCTSHTPTQQTGSPSLHTTDNAPHKETYRTPPPHTQP
ncbi:hypothetical protein CONLIGDRAFT_632924 [Coniochaeta ligniaria NRRL 30616]|uniref:Uncharacterized protein n=1 Tax=Coniochaeta ligniaria NRRL 30616 TaxID=1408157 RepID=A0A1J7JLU3_9PEZI|nr:hypothetical protein CONLIGDRAFT_632924 [Coniochaeta ligniaria NRRL 30616]